MASVAVAVISSLLFGLVLVVGPTQMATTAQQIFRGAPPEPEADLVAVADRSFLTEEGRALIYRSSPRLVDREQLAEACPTSAGGVSTMGCYSQIGGIVVYQPADVRLADTMVTILTHEMLHAAYDELGPGEVAGINDMLDAAIAQVPADDDVHTLIESSMRGHEGSRETETFAYLGSQVHPEGGFAPELEAVWSRFIADRPALVAVYGAAAGVVQAVVAESQSAIDQLKADEQADRQARAQLDADRAAHDAARERYAADAAQYDAIPESERSRWFETVTNADGTTVTRPFGESLEIRLADLEAYRVELDARTAALAESEAEVAARRSEVEAQWADMVALLEAAYPGQSFD